MWNQRDRVNQNSESSQTKKKLKRQTWESPKCAIFATYGKLYMQIVKDYQSKYRAPVEWKWLV